MSAGARRAALLVVAALALGAGLVAARLVLRAREPWSLLVVTIDTCRADALSAYGGAGARTPSLDALARDGVLFEHAYAELPLTLPSHATLFTGRQPDEHGTWNNGTYALPGSEVTLAEVLQSRGYRTAAFAGSFIVNADSGLAQGFDAFRDVTLDNSRGRRMPLEREATDVVADALAWLRDLPRSTPFFLWVHVYDPHHPYTPRAGLAPPGIEEPRASYLAEVTETDEALGTLLAGLRAGGRDRHTVIAVTSDHGESLGEHGEGTHGYFLYDSVLHVPLLIAAPGRLPAGRRRADPAGLVDLMPTLLTLLGAPVPETVTGHDLAPAGDEQGAARPLYAANLLPWLQVGSCPLHALRDGSYKLISSRDAELYDVTSDPRESRDLAADPGHAEELARLDRRLADFRAGMRAHDPARRAISAEDEEKLRSLVYLAGAGDRDDLEARGCARSAREGFVLQRALTDATVATLRGRPADAAAILERLLAREPDFHEARPALASALLQIGRADQAQGELEKVLAADAPLAARDGAALTLARLHAGAGRRDAALALLRRQLELSPRNADLWLELGRQAESAGASAEAETAYAIAHDLRPTPAPVAGAGRGAR